MLSRATLPTGHIEQGIGSLFSNARTTEPSVLFILADPGDEIVAAAGSVDELKDARFLHVTNGAPRDLAMAVDDGFFDRIEYAAARNREFLAALECAGLNQEQASELGFAAEDVSRNLATLTMSIATVLREQQPDIVITHAYEGTHADHDSIAFAVQTACELLEGDGLKAPLRIEAAGYS